MTDTLPQTATIAEAVLRELPASNRALGHAIERLRREHPSVALHETVAAARPALIAALFRALGRTLFVATPTADAAERILTDILYFIGENEPRSVALLRPRDEAIGAIESPSERSARMALFADLLDGTPRIVVAPVAALRQYVMPPALFASSRVLLEPGANAGWETTLNHLHRLGYTRTDVVSAAGEYAVRGGILDVFAPTASQPVRVEFFGDEIENIRSFALETQLSTGRCERVDIAPWSELPRDDVYRARVIERFAGPGNVRAAMRAHLDLGDDVPQPWLSLAYDERATVLDYLRDDALVVLDDPGMLATIDHALEDERAREENVLLAALGSDSAGAISVNEDDVQDALLADVAAPHPKLADLRGTLTERALLTFTGAIESVHGAALPQPRDAFVVECAPVEHFNRQIQLFTTTLREWTKAGETTLIVSSATSRIADILHAAGIPPERTATTLRMRERGRAEAALGAKPSGQVFIDHGSIESGFAIPDLRLRVIGDREIFGQPAKRVKLRAIKEGVPVTLADLKVGDYVVHAVHGIGRYLGLRTETILGATQDYIDLQFAGNDRMMVPVTQMHQISKYSAGEGGVPRLSKMGGADWARTKARVSESLAKIADGLVHLYAERELAQGHAFSGDSPWQAEIEEAFPYELTPDQKTAIDDTKGDMERQRPMDRLVCGDVGYGKTEVAIRAAFKAVAGKKQVAVLVPTTLLAAQHFRTFSARFAGLPLRIEELSRSKSKAEQNVILRDLAQGKVDIVIGTHRLLQKDVAFSDLGLIIVDEEQRFGVMHKERLKEYRASVDVLTLSATPIPRTLHMSLLGVRDLSLIQTAPKNRMSVKTIVAPTSDALIQHAIAAEIDRGGQVYYLHNRVETIHAVKSALQVLMPRARIAIAHGQMNEGEIEPIMQDFIDGDIDVLIATTIIENGIDIPNVNTIIVNNADMFGLAQLYQLRGRVGRSNHQAYAYLLYQGHKALSEEAKARLEAIREFTHLGSGLQIAMRDLEIRGAGNLLGSAQSGFIGSVGFDTYCQLLAEAIAQRRGMAAALEERREAVIDVKLNAYIPDDYIAQVSQKIAVYQQLARARSEAEVDEIAAGVRDRFGASPVPFDHLVDLTKLRTIALTKHVTRVVVDDERLTLGVGSSFAFDAAALPKFQSLTKNRFRFGESKIVVDLPKPKPGEAYDEIWLPLLRRLLDAM